jgi:hypothetical protein
VLRSYVGDCDWTPHAGRAVLDALTAAGKLAHDARVRAQAGEDIARYFDGWAAAAGAVHADAMVESWQEAARLARQVSKLGTPDG